MCGREGPAGVDALGGHTAVVVGEVGGEKGTGHADRDGGFDDDCGARACPGGDGAKSGGDVAGVYAVVGLE